MLAKDIKPGAVVNYNDAPHLIETVTVQSPSARGAATLYKYRARNLLTKQKADLVLKGGESLDEADFERRAVKFMYADPTHVHFLDDETYNQYSLPKDELEDELGWMTEELEGMLALLYNGECIGLQMPATVTLRIAECDPGVKGNSATSRNKPATLETGRVVQVPEYLKEGELVKVDTRTGNYLSRA